jgi:hypothetical protein
VRIDVAIVPVVGPAAAIAAAVAITTVIPPAATVAAAIPAAWIAPSAAIAATVTAAVDVDVVEVVIAADGVANVVADAIPNAIADIVAKAIANTGTIPADTRTARPITGTVAWAIRPVAADAWTITTDAWPIAIRPTATDLAGQRRRPIAATDAGTIRASAATTSEPAATAGANLTR